MKYITNIWYLIIFIGPFLFYLERKYPLNTSCNLKPFKSTLFDFSWELIDNYSYILILPLSFLLPNIYNSISFSFLGYYKEFTFSMTNFNIFSNNYILKFIVLFLLKDFLVYLFHRYFHRSAFWGLHAVHHSSKLVNWTSLCRNFFLDSLAINFFISIFLSFFSFDPMIDTCYNIVSLYFSFFVHSNIKLPSNKVLTRYNIFNTPLVHHWHHSVVSIYPGGQNFGNIFIIWDKVFGTYHVPEDGAAPAEYGVNDKEYRNNFLPMFQYSFFYFFKTIKKNLIKKSL